MTQEFKTIGILTSGGDAPGMNAAIRSVARSAIYKGFRVIGIRRGYHGLINEDMFEMNIRSVSEIIHRGGTVLYTARSPEFKTKAVLEEAKEICERNGIDVLVCIGGDGTMRGALALSEVGIPCVGIPGTIDNDLGCSDYTIGYDTAMNTAMEMIDNLRDTAQSHDRCSVVEVMGRNAGYLAVTTGVACGALAILVPEIPYDLDKDVIEKMLFTKGIGKRHFIVIVAEGSGSAVEIAEFIESRSGIEATPTVLGHVQRGGRPTTRDRHLASIMGFRAVELISSGVANRVIAHKFGKIVDFDIAEALKMKKTIDPTLLEMSQRISI
ncbi:MAG: 6-phosphofructokinase [Ruminococcaceae bacterium]|nr:6-phosphofructokinase [Oscillospiraceae bacterium]